MNGFFFAPPSLLRMAIKGLHNQFTNLKGKPGNRNEQQILADAKAEISKYRIINQGTITAHKLRSGSRILTTHTVNCNFVGLPTYRTADPHWWPAFQDDPTVTIKMFGLQGLKSINE